MFTSVLILIDNIFVFLNIDSSRNAWNFHRASSMVNIGVLSNQMQFPFYVS